MVLNDIISNALSNILNNEKLGKAHCTINPLSKNLLVVLEVMKNSNYIKDCKKIKISAGEALEITLNGAINKCGSIKPRFSVTKNEYEKFEKRFLPAKNFGILIISTSKGVMTHHEAQEKGLGGRLIAYCY